MLEQPLYYPLALRLAFVRDHLVGKRQFKDTWKTDIKRKATVARNAKAKPRGWKRHVDVLRWSPTVMCSQKLLRSDGQCTCKLASEARNQVRASGSGQVAINQTRIVNGIVATDFSNKLVQVKRATRHTHSNSFILPSETKTFIQQSFLPRTIRQWNNLPAAVAAASSLEIFKRGVAAIH